MSVCDTLPGLYLGRVRHEGESRIVYVYPAQAGRGVMLLPWWDERGPAESNVQVARSLEALLARA
jgi:hypothetical protein